MGALFDGLIYNPIYNVLIFLYNTVPGSDFGIAIILTTVLLKFILIPISKKQIESQKKMAELQPQIKELQNKYKNDKEKQTKELMEFYKRNKANPFSGCLPLIVQMIFLIAIYRILFNISSAGLVADGSALYAFVPNPGKINNFFLGFLDLTKPNYFLAVAAAIAQYFQTKMLMKKKGAEKEEEKKKDDKPDFASMMTKQMLYLGPAMTLMIGIQFPAGLALYWLVSTVFMIVQQMQIEKNAK